MRAFGILEPVEHGLLGGVEEDVLLGRHPSHKGGRQAQECPHLLTLYLLLFILTFLDFSPSFSFDLTSPPHSPHNFFTFLLLHMLIQFLGDELTTGKGVHHSSQAVCFSLSCYIFVFTSGLDPQIT